MSTTSDDMYRLHIDTDFCVDMMSTKKSTKIDQNQPKSTISLQKSTKIGRHHVDKQHQTDIRTTQGARTTRVCFMSILVYFMSTKCRHEVDLWSLLVDFGRFWSTSCRPKSTKTTCRLCVVDAVSTQSRQNRSHLFTMYPSLTARKNRNFVAFNVIYRA